MNKEEKDDNYWKGYIQKQKEAEEICKMCKYRKTYKELKQKESILDKVTDKLKEDIKETTLPCVIIGGRRNSKTLEYGKKLGRIETLKEILNIIEGEN